MLDLILFLAPLAAVLAVAGWLVIRAEQRAYDARMRAHARRLSVKVGPAVPPPLWPPLDVPSGRHARRERVGAGR